MIKRGGHISTEEAERMLLHKHSYEIRTSVRISDFLKKRQYEKAIDYIKSNNIFNLSNIDTGIPGIITMLVPLDSKPITDTELSKIQEVLDLLIYRGANRQNLALALRNAIWYHHENLARLLMSRGASLQYIQRSYFIDKESLNIYDNLNAPTINERTRKFQKQLEEQFTNENDFLREIDKLVLKLQSLQPLKVASVSKPLSNSRSGGQRSKLKSKGKPRVNPKP